MPKKKKKKACTRILLIASSLHPMSTPEAGVTPSNNNCANNDCTKDSTPRSCWKTCASTTMASLKFPLQDPLQAAATAATTALPQFLHNWSVCQQTDLFIQHKWRVASSEARCFVALVALKRRTMHLWKKPQSQGNVSEGIVIAVDDDNNVTSRAKWDPSAALPSAQQSGTKPNNV